MRFLRVAFKTLGCKLNQLETESVADAFIETGARLVKAEEEADLYVVNTCTVTSKAEQKARRVLRQALALNPQAVVLATGCYAQMEPEALALIDPRVIVLPGEEKASLLSLAAWLQDNWQGHGPLYDAVAQWKAELDAAGRPTSSPAHRPDPLKPSPPSRRAAPSAPDRFAYHPASFAFHSRPSLKMQDGCDNRCTYCRVCLARGPSVSLAADQAVARAQALEARGVAEVVLTGVNLSQYRDGELRFPKLLSRLIKETRSLRFRISSYEPDRIDEAFLEAFASPRIQPHVHLALQSGSSGVLRRMGRPYSAETAAQVITALRKARNDPFIAADIIVGFPGETDAEFDETMAFCRQADLAWIHAFPFSARPGTKAFEMRPKVPERLAGQRGALLAELASAGKHKYVNRHLCTEIEAVLERGGALREGDGLFEGTMEATSANYLKLLVRGLPPQAAPGQPISARIITALGQATTSTQPSLQSPELPGIDAIAEYCIPLQTNLR